jgi:hypothetical protein
VHLSLEEHAHRLEATRDLAVDAKRWRAAHVDATPPAAALGNSTGIQRA